MAIGLKTTRDGSGLQDESCDAALLHVFNPVSQGTRHDPNGEYVRQWVPELKDLPNKYIHAPWEAHPIYWPMRVLLWDKPIHNPLSTINPHG